MLPLTAGGPLAQRHGDALWRANVALAAVPGSLLPQRSLSQTNVRQYFADHPDLAPVLDRLYAFEKTL